MMFPVISMNHRWVVKRNLYLGLTKRSLHFGRGTVACVFVLSGKTEWSREIYPLTSHEYKICKKML